MLRTCVFLRHPYISAAQLQEWSMRKRVTYRAMMVVLVVMMRMIVMLVLVVVMMMEVMEVGDPLSLMFSSTSCWPTLLSNKACH